MKAFAPLLLLFTASVCHSQSYPDHGNNWHRICNLGTQGDKIACSAYVFGFLDGATMQAGLTKQQSFFCIPPQAQMGQATDVFAKYLADHPEKRHLPGEALLSLALMNAFPCPK
jgi:hypothetical protein